MSPPQISLHSHIFLLVFLFFSKIIANNTIMTMNNAIVIMFCSIKFITGANGFGLFRTFTEIGMRSPEYTFPSPMASLNTMYVLLSPEWPSLAASSEVAPQPRQWRGWANEPSRLKIQSSYRILWLRLLNEIRTYFRENPDAEF